jgi:lipoate-protein ligase A
MTMFILDSPSTDPYFNIAAEEYLLKERDGNYAFIYINAPSIIIGKHQNAYAEINLPWVLENRIPVVRRISGGGTVWHDPGNVNFSFILNGEPGKLVDFRHYAGPVMDYLRSLNLPAEFGSRNEILVGGMKISGNAEHVYRSRVLHHGTLLYHADLTALEAALKVEESRYTDKAVQSVRSEVENILALLERKEDISVFRKGLVDHLSGSLSESVRYVFDDEDIEKINERVSRKYSTWKWNIGYSPRYQMSCEIDWEGEPVVVRLEVETGKIKSIRFDVDKDERGFFNQLARLLEGMEHDPAQVRGKILDTGLVNPALIDKFIEAIF